MSIQDLLSLWRTDPQTAPNLPIWRTTPPRPADLRPLPDDLPPRLMYSLKKARHHLPVQPPGAGLGGCPAGRKYCARHRHRQRQDPGLQPARPGSPAGGTLTPGRYISSPPKPWHRINYRCSTGCWVRSARVRVICRRWHLPSMTVTPRRDIAARSASKARIILSNPDMLHTGILPHHTNWADFFRSLRFVVIDEMHTYRGVFGSHVANVLRRLKRVAKFYGAQPQFILTSATIGNPQELAETTDRGAGHAGRQWTVPRAASVIS